MLRKIDRDIWVAEQQFRYFGLSIGTRMTVIQLANRELAVVSPIQANDAIVGQLNQLGVVKHIIAPQSLSLFVCSQLQITLPTGNILGHVRLRSEKARTVD